MDDSTSIHGCEKIEGYSLLEELAMNLIWSWNHRSNEIWKRLDPDLWECTQNPWALLQSVSCEKLTEALKDSSFKACVDEMIEKKRARESSTSWFNESYPNAALQCVAYFSMEYMLSEALPIYSGGLGNVAGDQLKAASDLGVPVIGIGLLYQQGYFRQTIDKEGKQQAIFPFNSPDQLPIKPLRCKNGQWIRIRLDLPGWSTWIRCWEADVGRARLFLLDCNDLANYPPHRGITGELYGGAKEIRFQQELVLGIGGWRLLETLGISLQVCHLNEGHAAFAVLERAKSHMQKEKISFFEALEKTKCGNLFTTHTAVAAGFDRYPPDLIEQFLKQYAEKELKISLKELLGLGRSNPEDANEPFNMAFLAAKASRQISAVSKLHSHVSKSIFQPLFPNLAKDQIPIDYVTNGVHVPTWDSPMADSVWADLCGSNRWYKETECLEESLKQITNEALWQMRNEARAHLIEYTRKRLYRLWTERGYLPEEIEKAKSMFDPNVLTLGFSRRFATYKRPNMLLHDTQRLQRILTNEKRPVQLLIAGKAHPADEPGQSMIQEWLRFIYQPAIRPYVIFLSDYDMQMAWHLVAGIDLWINTPRRPWEACGTSGMKILSNGGLNLSELDGWWAEAYSPDVGWALGDGLDRGEDPQWDAQEANMLYDLLEKEIIELFYQRNEQNIPIAWIDKIRKSMAKLTAQYSANRAVREYTEKFYLPMAKQFQAVSSR